MPTVRPLPFLLALALLAAPLQGCALWRLAMRGAPAPVPYDERLQAELSEMLVEDQATRAEHDTAATERADRRHAERLKALIERDGWPTRARVGETGALAAWLIAEHADFDPAFQRRCLGLLRDAANDDQASELHWAYLTDHVLVNEGKPQRYGTVWTVRNGELVAQPIEDPERLDRRRKQVGLPPYAEALAAARATYRQHHAGPEAPERAR